MIARFLFLVMLLASVAGGAARAQEAAPAVAGRPAPRVTVTQAREAEVVADAVVTGTLVARRDVLVTPQIEGLRIKTLEADEGDLVAAGQVLATLDRATTETELAQSDAALAKAKAGIAQAGATIAEAEATLAEANAALERARTLRKSGNSTQQELDQRTAAQKSAEARLAAAQAGITVAEADVAQAEAQRLSLQLRLSRTDVVAPERGLVLARNARVGGIATSIGDPMFRIVADGAVELEAGVLETLLPRISSGDPASVDAAGITGVPGTVRLVSPEVDAATRLGTVRISLPADNSLRIGSFARARIVTDRRQAVTVPATAVLNDETESFVQVVVDGTIETREVTTGILSGDDWEITNGLQAGETVLARAGAFFQDGDKVTAVVTETPAAGTPEGEKPIAEAPIAKASMPVSENAASR